MATFDLTPDVWTSFVIKAAVDPSGNNGSFLVWDNPDGKPRAFNGPYGYSAGGKCGDRKQSSQQFRLKFGIYKGTEPNRRHEVDFDNIRIGSSFDAVSPWKHGR